MSKDKSDKKRGQNRPPAEAKELEAQEAAVPEGESVAPVPALAQVENANQLIAQSVLYNDQKVHFAGTLKPMADQAAAMMVEDTRTFMQGMEQILTMAFAKASSMVLEGEQEQGAAAIATFTALMQNLPVFAQRVGQVASNITATFEDGQAGDKVELVACTAVPPNKKKQAYQSLSVDPQS